MTQHYGILQGADESIAMQVVTCNGILLNIQYILLVANVWFNTMLSKPNRVRQL